MATVGFIGSGRIGGTVARLSVAAGHMVILSNSRGPETLKDLVTELGPMARACAVNDAAEDGDLVVVATPLAAFRHVPVRPVVDKAVLDACNYYPARDGNIADLDSGQVTSSELLQRHLPGASVVKVFNTIYYKHLRNLGLAGQRPGSLLSAHRGRQHAGHRRGGPVPGLDRLRRRRLRPAGRELAAAARPAGVRHGVRAHG